MATDRYIIIIIIIIFQYFLFLLYLFCYLLKYLFTYLFFYFLLCINVVNLLSKKKKKNLVSRALSQLIMRVNKPTFA